MDRIQPKFAIGDLVYAIKRRASDRKWRLIAGEYNEACACNVIGINMRLYYDGPATWYLLDTGFSRCIGREDAVKVTGDNVFASAEEAEEAARRRNNEIN